MEHTGASDSLHRQVVEAVERGARAQRESRALLARHREVDAALRDTLATIRERQRATAEGKSSPPQC